MFCLAEWFPLGTMSPGFVSSLPQRESFQATCAELRRILIFHRLAHRARKAPVLGSTGLIHQLLTIGHQVAAK